MAKVTTEDLAIALKWIETGSPEARARRRPINAPVITDKAAALQEAMDAIEGVPPEKGLSKQGGA